MEVWGPAPTERPITKAEVADNAPLLSVGAGSLHWKGPPAPGAQSKGQSPRRRGSTASGAGTPAHICAQISPKAQSLLTTTAQDLGLRNFLRKAVAGPM